MTNKGMVLGADGGMQVSHDPGLFIASATLAPGVAHETAEKALIAEIERIKTGGVTQEEIDNVIAQQRASEAYGRDGVSGVASSLCEWIAAGDWALFVNYIDKLAKVTPADVQRVAETYLNEDQSTTGWFVPVVSK
jgi:zinc protease